MTIIESQIPLLGPDELEAPVTELSNLASAEAFAQACEQHGFESFAGALYFEGREISVGGLLRLAMNIGPAELAAVGASVGPYLAHNPHTGEIKSYTGIMLYRRQENNDD